jgi:hypothetical protein
MPNTIDPVQLFEDSLTLAWLAGQIPTEIKSDETEIYILLDNGVECKLSHHQDCCESVYVDDVCGDWDDLIGVPLVHAEERTGDYIDDNRSTDESVTWTFYDFQSTKGSVNVRWCGESNGYYSESISFDFTIRDKVKFRLLYPEYFI